MAGAPADGASPSRHDGFSGARDARIIAEYGLEFYEGEAFCAVQRVPGTEGLLRRAGVRMRAVRPGEFARVAVRRCARLDRWELAPVRAGSAGEGGAEVSEGSEISGPVSAGAGPAAGAGAIGGEGLKNPCLDASPPPAVGVFFVLARRLERSTRRAAAMWEGRPDRWEWDDEWLAGLRRELRRCDGLRHAIAIRTMGGGR
jgi:hypothetical protein